jgi:hypothetical protein
MLSYRALGELLIITNMTLYLLTVAQDMATNIITGLIFNEIHHDISRSQAG